MERRGWQNGRNEVLKDKVVFGNKPTVVKRIMEKTSVRAQVFGSYPSFSSTFMFFLILWKNIFQKELRIKKIL